MGVDKHKSSPKSVKAENGPSKTTMKTLSKMTKTTKGTDNALQGKS